MPQQIPKRVRDAVHERAGGRCERCFSPGPLELHHRKFRSRGGKHTVENITALCGLGNMQGCHGYAHTVGGDGWAVHSWENELDVRVIDVQGNWWYFTKDGRRLPSEDPPF